MTFTKKIEILKKKVAIRYSVDEHMIDLEHSVGTMQDEPAVIFITVRGGGRSTQLSPTEVDSLNKSLNFYDTIMIIERCKNNKDTDWVMSTYLPKKSNQ